MKKHTDTTRVNRAKITFKDNDYYANVFITYSYEYKEEKKYDIPDAPVRVNHEVVDAGIFDIMYVDKDGLQNNVLWESNEDLLDYIEENKNLLFSKYIL